MTPSQTISQLYQLRQLQGFSTTLLLRSRIEAQDSKIYQLGRLIINLLALTNQTGKTLNTTNQRQHVTCEQQMART